MNKLKIEVDHSQDCAGMQAVNSGTWDHPWWMDTVDPIEWRDKNGGKRGHHTPFVRLICNGGCPAIALLSFNDSIGWAIQERLSLVEQVVHSSHPTSTTLEEKLKDKVKLLIQGLPDSDGGIANSELDEAFEQIKQAFINDGWNRPFDDKGIINFGTKENPILIHKDSLPFSGPQDGGSIAIPENHGGKVLMTGQEWYDKFMQGLWEPTKFKLLTGPRFYRVSGQHFMRRQAIEAAKRASGITEDK